MQGDIKIVDSTKGEKQEEKKTKKKNKTNKIVQEKERPRNHHIFTIESKS